MTPKIPGTACATRSMSGLAKLLMKNICPRTWVIGESEGTTDGGKWYCFSSDACDVHSSIRALAQ